MIKHDRHTAVLQHVQRCAIRALQYFGNQRLAGWAVGDDFAIEAHQPWQVRRQAVEVVGGEQNRAPLAVQIAQQMQNLMPRAHIDAAGGFVQNQNVGLAKHRPGHEHALLLTAAEFANVAAFQTMQPQPLEHFFHLGTFAARCARPVPAGASHG